MIQRQTALRATVSLSGTGVHSGQSSSLSIHPAPAGSGIRFKRKGLDATVPATSAHVSDTQLCTVLGDPRRGGVATVEHLMAALAGLGVDNALVEVDGPEVPILDGSSLPFVEAIDAVGLRELDLPRRHLRVLRSVEVERDGCHARLDPSPRGFHLDVGIDFANPVIGRQEIALSLTPETFRREIADCRTFGFLRDVQRLWAAGLALGASMENTVVLAEHGVASPGGLRRPDEFVRHKLLDAVGDLSLAGLPIVGAYRSRRGGHALNALVLRTLLSDPANYDVVGVPATALALPPLRRTAGA